jgi:hypothetical protein
MESKSNQNLKTNNIHIYTSQHRTKQQIRDLEKLEVIPSNYIYMYVKKYKEAILKKRRSKHNKELKSSMEITTISIKFLCTM